MTILGWIMGGGGFLLSLISLSAMRVNEKEIKQLQDKIKAAKPWDLTDFWEKQLTATENANARATVLLFIGVFLMAAPLLAWLFC